VPRSLFHEVINGLLELRSVPTGTTLDQQQWAALQQHLEQTAAADAAAAAAAGAADAQAGQAGGMQPPTGGQQQGGGPLVHGSSFGLPTVPQHQRRRGGPQRAGSIAASMRVGHIPAGSTDAVACTLNGTRSAFTAAMHIALGDACPLDVLRVDEADGRHAFATCMLSYGFMGDVMVESENYRWLGPLRYDVIGAKMLAANRSYHVRVSYLPAQSEQLEAAGKVCTAGCDLCRLGQEHVRLQRTFREVSSRSLAHRRSEWVHVEGDFAGIMLVIMPCRSEKSQQGVARYGHRSDGLIHLVMVKKCSRLQYLRFLLTLSHSGLAAGEHGFFTVVPAVAVHVEPVGAKQSRWNADGELLASNHITAEVHRGVIEVFARGVEV
jgi:ceramide kinase